MIAKKKAASSGLPSCTEPPTLPSPKTPSHSEKNREPLTMIQKNGSQSALVTLGRSRKSRRNNQAMNATHRTAAIFGGNMRLVAGRNQRRAVRPATSLRNLFSSMSQLFCS